MAKDEFPQFDETIPSILGVSSFLLLWWFGGEKKKNQINSISCFNINTSQVLFSQYVSPEQMHHLKIKVNLSNLSIQKFSDREIKEDHWCQEQC